MKKSSLKHEDFHTFLENMWDAVFIVDYEKKVRYWNKALTELSGYSSEEALGKTCNLLYSMNVSNTNILCNVSCPCLPVFQHKPSHEKQMVLKTKEDVSVPIFQRIMPYYENETDKKNNKPSGCIHILRRLAGGDETAPLIHELNYLAYIEPLTQTARRNYGDIMLQKSLNTFLSASIPFGILMIDLDEFKDVNDRFGHIVGDRVLVTIVSVIKKNLRQSDLLVRYGGDEFLLITPNSEQKILTSLGNKLSRLINNMKMVHNDRSIPMSISIGGAMPTHEDTIDSLLTRADTNMYLCKKEGKNRCIVS